MAPDLEVAVVKATSHDEDAADEKHIRLIAILISRSSGYVYACVVAISKRLRKTRDWVVVLKSLMLVDRLLNEGDELFRVEIKGLSRKGVRDLKLGDFRDETHSSSWDHSAFVRAYALYLDEKVELLMFERKGGRGGSLGDGDGSVDRHREFEVVGGTRLTRSFGDVNMNSSSDSKKPVTPFCENESFAEAVG